MSARKQTNTPAAAKDIAKGAAKSGTLDLRNFTHYTHTSLVQAIYLQADTIKNQRRNNLILLGVTALLTVMLGIAVSQPSPKPEYFGWDGSKFVRIEPLSEPPVNINAARNWVEACIINALDISFINPIKRINTIINDCFNDNGKLAYQQWLTKGASSELVTIGKAGSVPVDSELGQIISKRIALDASVKAPSRIIPIDPIKDAETDETILRWEVSFPVIIRKEVADVGSGTATIVVKTIIVRNNSEQYPHGVAIDSFNLTRG